MKLLKICEADFKLPNKYLDRSKFPELKSIISNVNKSLKNFKAEEVKLLLENENKYNEFSVEAVGINNELIDVV